ncbi:hypothetical protein B0T26DRAFT_802505 [Lasiosphaeria miniovina]|uniref:Uncharacterized protein n=1 Tax=Lasiosphaeria miniovina TaxID=1954250 RepID=A0AA40AK99_9PEZI|nr:uncharacterized protein B0T26DRAFT_802505 [Lasiosphaeria miniovina]KAK0717344.1 hypothetical protein B0T26DRAFT_802505 [Lasiosphaeria miniovina]
MGPRKDGYSKAKTPSSGDRDSRNDRISTNAGIKIERLKKEKDDLEYDLKSLKGQMQSEKVSVLKKEKRGLEDQVKSLKAEIQNVVDKWQQTYNALGKKYIDVSTELRKADRDLAEVDAKYSRSIAKHSKLQTTVDDLKKELQEERNHSAAFMKNIEAQEEIVTKAHSTAISLLARDVSSDFPDDEIKKEIRNFLQNSLFGWCADNSARRIAGPETAGPFLKQRGLLLRNNDDLPEHLQFDIQHNMAPVVLLQAALAHELLRSELEMATPQAPAPEPAYAPESDHRPAELNMGGAYMAANPLPDSYNTSLHSHT